MQGRKEPGLCREEPLLVDLIKKIDTDNWRRRWGSVDLGEPNWIIGFAQLCYNARRPELVSIIAETIMATAQLEHFSRLNQRHLSYILSAAPDSNPALIHGFLNRCIRPDWVTACYLTDQAAVGALAGSVRSFALHESKEVRDFFRNDALFGRLWAEVPSPEHDAKHVAEWLQLLAPVGLLGRSIPPRTFQPLGQDRLNSALLSHPPMPDRGITANQAGLWHGVREWLHLDQESFTADRSLAEDVLRAFRAAESGGRRRIALLNGIMVDWLEQCQAQGWRLIPEERSLFDALEDAGED